MMLPSPSSVTSHRAGSRPSWVQRAENSLAATGTLRDMASPSNVNSPNNFAISLTLLLLLWLLMCGVYCVVVVGVVVDGVWCLLLLLLLWLLMCGVYCCCCCRGG